MKKFLLALAGITTATVLFYFLKLNQFYQRIYTPIANKQKNNKVKLDKTQFSILLLGYAGSNYAGTYLTDTMIVMHFDSKKKQALMISLPRDLWLKLPTKSGADFHAKANTIYETELFPNTFPDLDTKIAGSISDAELTKYILSQITGLEIDNYITIDFASFTKAVDIIGGVDINVLKTFTDEKYPSEGKENDLCGKEEDFKKIEPYLNGIDATGSAEKEKLLQEQPALEEFLRNATESPHLAFPCRYERIHFASGQQHMDGATALKFSRSRQSLQDGGDFARARRQQQLLEAVKEKVFSVGFIAKLPALLDEMEKYVKTDIAPDQIQRFLKEASSAKEYSLTSLVLSDQNVLKATRSENGQFILIPDKGMDDWIPVQRFIKNTIDGSTPTPTPTPGKKSIPAN